MRKNLGLGMGKGYKNLIPHDPFVHSMSAKGVGKFVTSPKEFFAREELNPSHVKITYPFSSKKKAKAFLGLKAKGDSTKIAKVKQYLNICPDCKESLQRYPWHDSKECRCGFSRHWSERYWNKKDYLDFYRKNKNLFSNKWEVWNGEPQGNLEIKYFNNKAKAQAQLKKYKNTGLKNAKMELMEMRDTYKNMNSIQYHKTI
jgi:hypothetical protein